MSEIKEDATDNVQITGQKRRREILIITLIGIALIIGFIYFTMGLFVVQPIGAIPEGATVLYWRYGAKLPVISSADGLLSKKEQGVSLLGRAVALGTIGTLVTERKIIKFPYSRTLYLISTGGREFEK